MNAPVKLPNEPLVIVRKKVERPLRADQEFLAPALEILETPPSPVHMALIIIITTLFAIAIIWAAVGKVDIVATAQGKVEPTRKVKIVQPLATGKVSEVLVQNGDHVTKDEVLVRLDDASAASQFDDLTQQLAASQAEVARRRAAIAAVGSKDWRSGKDVHIKVDWPQGIPASVQQREQSVLDQDLGQLAAQLSLIDSQIAQKTIDLTALTSTVSAHESLVSTLKKLSSMHATLAGNGTSSTADWLTALQTEEREQVSLQSDITQQVDADANLTVLRRQSMSAVQTFLADYTQKFEAADEQVQDLTQKVRQAKAALSDMTLFSPVDGTIEASTLTSTGQVLESGSEVMRVVPEGSHLDIQAYLTNDEIGFVKAGQDATIKVDAFPYTQYGTINGVVLKVGKDAVSAAQAQADLADSSFTMTTSSAGNTSQSSDSLVFPITVQLDSNYIGNMKGKAYVSPGMSVSVDINTGKRTILDYLFAPLVDITSSALHER